MVKRRTTALMELDASDSEISKTKSDLINIVKKRKIEASNDDGYDDNLMDDETNRKILSCLSEKQRDANIFKRIEQHDIIRLCWEFKKLKLTEKCEEDKKRQEEGTRVEKNLGNTTQNSLVFPEIEIAHETENEIHKTRNCMEYFETVPSGSIELPKDISSNDLNVAAGEYFDHKERPIRKEKAHVEEKEGTRYSQIDREDVREELKSGKCSSELEKEVSKERQTRLINSRKELNKICLPRYIMEKYINLPIFKRTVLNCFVRVSIGKNEQKSVYRVAEIVGVVETKKIYYLGKTPTNKRLLLKYGNREHTYSLDYISNHKFTDSEFSKWREVCIQQNVQIPSLALIDKKVAEIKAASNYEFKDKDTKEKHIVDDAEKAILKEPQANKFADPFSRTIERQDTDYDEEVSFVPHVKNKLDHVECIIKNNDNYYDPYSLHDFDVGLDIKVPLIILNNFPKPVPKIPVPATTRSVNIEAYKREKGLI